MYRCLALGTNSFWQWRWTDQSLVAALLWSLVTCLMVTIFCPNCVLFFSQALGVSSQSDRSTIKKKLKELRKAQEKLEKQREKKEKEVRRSGRLPVSNDSVCWASSSPSPSQQNYDQHFFILLVPWRQRHVLLMPTTSEHDWQGWTFADWGASYDFWKKLQHPVCLRITVSFEYFNIFSAQTILTERWGMSKNKQKRWVYDQKGILTFCTTKKLKAIIINIILLLLLL